MKTIAIAGTFDTKGSEYTYVSNLIKKQGFDTLHIHVGTFSPAFKPDVSNAEVASAADEDISVIVKKNDRAWATEVMSKGMEKLIPKLYNDGKFHGIISLGGSGGTSIVTPGMRALPVGVPKLMVSTMASGNTEQYIGTSDIVMMPSVVDIAGLNSISIKILSNAAFAICGMVGFENSIEIKEKPSVAITMFGVTTPCVQFAREYFETCGYEVLVFHATGVGGRSMENLIEAGYFKGVLDITTTEWCDELFGGVLSAGPHRCEAAAKKSIPQVVSVGALDMVNFYAFNTVPEKYAHRNLYKHNPTVTLMRTSIKENISLGKKLSEKLNMATGKSALFIPLGGVSAIDAPNQPFYGEHEDKALFKTLLDNVDASTTEIVQLDLHINDKDFAIAAAQKLIEFMET